MNRFHSVYLWSDTRQKLREILTSREGPTVNFLLNLGILELTSRQIDQAMRDAKRQRNGDGARQHVEGEKVNVQ